MKIGGRYGGAGRIFQKYFSKKKLRAQCRGCFFLHPYINVNEVGAM